MYIIDVIGALLKPKCAHELPKDLVKIQIRTHWCGGLGICCSDKLPSEVRTADLRKPKGLGQWFSRCDHLTRQHWQLLRPCYKCHVMTPSHSYSLRNSGIKSTIGILASPGGDSNGNQRKEHKLWIQADLTVGLCHSRLEQIL